MRKWIDGILYLIRLPYYHEMAYILDKIGASAEYFSTKSIRSWARTNETSAKYRQLWRVDVRNGILEQREAREGAISPGNAFTPLIIPIDLRTGRPDTTFMKDVKPGEIVPLCSVLVDGKLNAASNAQKILTWPTGGKTFELTNLSHDPKFQIHAVSFGTGFLPTQPMLKSISYVQIQSLGYCDNGDITDGYMPGD